VTETTPEEISPEVIAFCESFGAKAPLYVPVQQDPSGIYGMCFIGVADKIKAGGGFDLPWLGDLGNAATAVSDCRVSCSMGKPRKRANRHYTEAATRNPHRLCA
jgi:hypothetical protein